MTAAREKALEAEHAKASREKITVDAADKARRVRPLPRSAPVPVRFARACAALFCTVAVVSISALSCILLHGTALPYSVLCCTGLYCTGLCCSVPATVTAHERLLGFGYGCGTQASSLHQQKLGLEEISAKVEGIAARVLKT